MKAIAELMIAATDLVEAEGRALRRGVAKLVLAMVLLCVGGLFVLLGLGLAIWGLYGVLAPQLGAGGAALIGALAAVLAAVMIILVGKWTAR